MPGDPKEFVLGGQAVIEGVMMKGPASYAVAVRKPQGEILVRNFPISSDAAHRRFAGTPVLRGILTMGAMLAIGYRSLRFSAREAMEDADGAGGVEAGTAVGEAGRDGSLAMAAALILALFIAVAIFFWLPLAGARALAALWPAAGNRIAFNVADGLFRVAAFVGYVLAIGAMRDVRRLFAYHGAEHKVVNAYEANADLSPDAVAPFPVLHPRCGTSFLLLVMVVSVAVFSFIPHGSSLAAKALMRLLLLPAVAGISYEILRFSARRASVPLVRALVAPGLWLQRLTTREPDRGQLEVAIASFRGVAGGGRAEAPRVG